MRLRARFFLLVLLGVFAGSTSAANNPVPHIDSPLVPTSTAPGGPAFTLTIHGSGFVLASVANWNGSPRTTTFVNAGEVTAAIPASDIATERTAAVTVKNPPPGGGTSNVMFFQVSSPLLGNPPFTPIVQSTGSNVVGPVVTGDFNGDGKLDVAYLNVSGPDLVVQLGNGDGSFQAPLSSPYPPGGAIAVFALAAADFNGDGQLDLALLGEGGPFSVVTILLGKGDGTFQPAQKGPSPSVYFPSNIFAADFNGDGNVDLLLSGQSFQTPGGTQFAPLVLYLGNGDGTFQGGIPFNNLAATAIGDFNGDGVLDLVFLGGIALGNGDGTFQAPKTISMSQPNDAIQTMIAADVNGDGKLDLVLGLSLDGVGIMLGNGDGTFQTPVNYPIGPNSGCGCDVQGLAAADFNGDGKLDLLVGLNPNNPGSPLWILSGNGDGTFQAPTTYSIQGFTAPDAAALGDFNNDGKMDFVVAANGPSGSGTNNVTFYLQGQLPFASAAPATLDFGSQNVGSTSSPQAVTLTNSGLAPLTISNISIGGANGGDFVLNNGCRTSLAPNASCSIGVFFDPAAGGARTGTLTVTDDAGDSPQRIPLSGSGQDFSVGAIGAASATISAGQTASYTLTFAPMGGLNQTIALSCSGAPAMSTCSVSPSTVSLNGTTAATAMVTVATTAHGWVLPFGPHAPGRVNYPLIFTLLVTFVMVVVLLLWRREQRFQWAQLFALAVLVCLGMTLTSCGGGSGGSGRSTGTQAGTYSITVSGSFTSGSTTLTHTTKLTLVVQ